MPPSAIRGPKSKQATGRKRSKRNEDEQHTAGGRDGSNGAWDADSMTGEDSRSGSADAMQTNKRSRTASSAAASSASSSSSAAASASASSAPTPCSRLDADSLSVVFSFLNMQDFLRAVRVSRHWRAARTKRSAWPAFSLQTMIQSLRDDDFNSPQRRKFELAIKSGNKTKLSALLSQPAVRDMWRHVTEVKLVHERVGSNKEGAASAAMMTQLPQFASLAALTLDGFIVDGAAAQSITDLLSALSSRLLMLGLFRCSDAFTSQLHRLSSLRILVLGWIPDAASLLPLHQLVYLHIEPDPRSDFPQPSALLGYVIRWLSVHHQLRSLSVEGFPEDDLQVCLFALLSCEAADDPDADLQLAALNARGLQPQLERSVPCALTDLSVDEMGLDTVELVNSAPSLTRLQSFVPSQYAELTWPRLQQLRLTGGAAFRDWNDLVDCTALRVVHLKQYRLWSLDLTSITQATLQSLFSAWAATLEECRLDPVRVETRGADSGNEDWAELAACRRLRILDLRMEKDQVVPAGLVSALQGLPSFQTLVLRSDEAEICSLPSNLLSVMARSSSFSTLHLHSSSDSPHAPDFVQPAEAAKGRGLSAMLSALAHSDRALLTAQNINRLRVVGHRSVTCASEVHSYRIVLAGGHPNWAQEY